MEMFLYQYFYIKYRDVNIYRKSRIQFLFHKNNSDSYHNNFVVSLIKYKFLKHFFMNIGHWKLLVCHTLFVFFFLFIYTGCKKRISTIIKLIKLSLFTLYIPIYTFLITTLNAKAKINNF